MRSTKHRFCFFPRPPHTRKPRLDLLPKLIGENPQRRIFERLPFGRWVGAVDALARIWVAQLATLIVDDAADILLVLEYAVLPGSAAIDRVPGPPAAAGRRDAVGVSR